MTWFHYFFSYFWLFHEYLWWEHLKPHFFTKTGQKLVFLHKNKWTFLCETGKIGTPVSRKRVSFTQKSTVSRFTVNLRKNKWTLSKCQLLCSQGVVSFTQKRSKLLPSWLWDGKFYHQVGKKRKFDRNCWIHGKNFNHEIASFTKWNWKKS